MSNITPSLVDNVELLKITQALEMTSKPKGVKNIFGFFDTYNRDTIVYIVMFIFFILIAIFLYLRYKNKQNKLSNNTKMQAINTFVINNSQFM
jgi:preprotein translocase subunit SecG